MSDLTNTKVYVRDRRLENRDFAEIEVGAYFLWKGDLWRKVKSPSERVFAVHVADAIPVLCGDNVRVEVVPVVQVMVYSMEEAIC